MVVHVSAEAPQDHSGNLTKLTVREEKSALSFWRITHYWPWDLIPLEYHPEKWTAGMLCQLSSFANDRRKAGHDDRLHIEALRQILLGRIEQRVNFRYHGLWSLRVLQSKDIITARKALKLMSKRNRRPQGVHHSPETSDSSEDEEAESVGNCACINGEGEKESENEAVVQEVMDLIDLTGSTTGGTKSKGIPSPAPASNAVGTYLQPNCDRLGKRVRSLVDNRRQQQNDVIARLELAQADWDSVTARLEDALAKTGEPIVEGYHEQLKDAKSVLIAATWRAGAAEQTVNQLKGWFQPTNEGQEEFLRQVVRKVQAAVQAKEDAAANVQCLEKASEQAILTLKDQQQAATATLTRLKSEHNAIEKESEALRLFGAIVELGPNELYSRVQSTKLLEVLQEGSGQGDYQRGR
ncbi:hypothetical protein N0V93_010325 [Gnomoniopsis smithogilvyi]|uniref:Uncharacterized protein n=1 Tax=Gnomoniopsis smithogilvyi TaxID=1191159 RepID=A0A9W8YHM3_9PEZI|nr:hypothetical protein N0V93_010325 [Gnomoniopsis smithogilvyi]